MSEKISNFQTELLKVRLQRVRDALQRYVVSEGSDVAAGYTIMCAVKDDLIIFESAYPEPIPVIAPYLSKGWYPILRTARRGLLTTVNNSDSVTYSCN